jgi:hypothetical protein
MIVANALSVKSEARLPGGRANSKKVGDEVTRLILQVIIRRLPRQGEGENS